jgi:hypothetical protein
MPGNWCVTLDAHSRFESMRRILVAGTATALVATGVLVSQSVSEDQSVSPDSSSPEAVALSDSCAPGYVTISSVAREVANGMAREGESSEMARFQLEMAEEGAEVDTELTAELARELPQSAQVDSADWDRWCVPRKRPESVNELGALAAERAIPRMAPLPQGYQPGAFAAAVRQRGSMAPGSVRGTGGTGRLYGRGPLIVGQPRRVIATEQQVTELHRCGAVGKHRGELRHNLLR